MITVNMYEIGEPVLIKASVIDIAVEQGKLKYKLRVEHTNDELEHTFSENQIMPIIKTPVGKETLDGGVKVEEKQDS